MDKVLEDLTAYCVRCKKKVEIIDYYIANFKGKGIERQALKGTCPICHTNCTKFLGLA